MFRPLPGFAQGVFILLLLAWALPVFTQASEREQSSRPNILLIVADDLLRDAGYHTYTAGKWHLGTAEEHSPLQAEFERSFSLVDGSVAPLLGSSLLPFLAGQAENVHPDTYVTTLSHRGRSFVRQGKWRLVADDQPFDEEKFELSDLDADPGETRNLAGEFPDKMEELLTLWRIQRVELGIVLPEDL